MEASRWRRKLQRCTLGQAERREFVPLDGHSESLWSGAGNEEATEATCLTVDDGEAPCDEEGICGEPEYSEGPCRSRDFEALGTPRRLLLLRFGVVLALCGTALVTWRSGPRLPWQVMDSGSVITKMTTASLYSPYAAKAFAVLAKLAYCGDAAGMFSSVAFSCGSSAIPGYASACQKAGFVVEPGSVRMIQVEDQGYPDAIFAYMGKVSSVPFNHFEAARPDVLDGCVLAFRGSIDHWSNDLRTTEEDLVSFEGGPAGDFCEGCGVHKGFLQVWRKIASKVDYDLAWLGCQPGSRLYLTGHGTGGAVAVLAMYELKMMGYDVQGGYIFEAPRAGNITFTERFATQLGEPGLVFRITHSKDISPRWPRHTTEKAWKHVGYQVYYPEEDEEQYTICDDYSLEGCGIDAIARAELTQDDTCPHPLAHEGNFCTFGNQAATCYGGVGLEWRELDEPFPQTTASTTQKGVMEIAGSNYDSPTVNPRPRGAFMDPTAHEADFAGTSAVPYNGGLAKAFAALSKLSFCGPAPGLYASVQMTCGPACEEAGLAVVPGSVRFFGAADREVPHAIFGYVARLGAIGRLPGTTYSRTVEDSCIIVFRGTDNKANEVSDTESELIEIDAANSFRNMQEEMVNIDPASAACKGCKVHRGYFRVWRMLRQDLGKQLGEVGCRASKGVHVTGFSMGGAVATLAMLELRREGFTVLPSYTFEAPRTGNKAFAKTVQDVGISLFRITHSKDRIPRTPRSDLGFMHAGQEVHYSNATGSYKYELCTFNSTVSCGVGKLPREELSASRYHCPSPLAPFQDMCDFKNHTSACLTGESIATTV
mmetsp:Transcript_7685/g.20690  ORF Transcript_7685/g.20690 Transcript_7685/m.20690 type:complete len:823 (+) Transcript_7685:109-2577(+)